MKIPDGLYFFEFVLLLLGVLLFVTLLIILIIYTVQKRSPKVLLPFFILPIAMIGYPGYEKLTFDKGVITIEKLRHELATNPENKTAMNELSQLLLNVEKRPISNAGTNLKIGRAQAVIGDTLKALTYIDRAIRQDSNLRAAKELQKNFNTQGVRIEKMTEEVDKNPGDVQLREKFSQEVKKYEQSSTSGPLTYERLARSYAALGDTSKVNVYTDSLRKTDAQSKQTVNQLRNRFKLPINN